MANTKSAKKQIRKAVVRNRINKFWKDKVKYNIKNFLRELKGTNNKVVKDNFIKLQSTLDKAGGKGIISKNKVSRVKSRLSRSASLNRKT